MMKTKLKSWATFTLRWGIAIAGIAYVLSKTSFHDRVKLVDPNSGREEMIRVVDGSAESDRAFTAFYSHHPISRDEVWTAPDRPSVVISEPDGKEAKAKLLAVLPEPDQQPRQAPRALLIEDPQNGKNEVIDPSRVVGGYKVRVPHPLVDIGLVRLVRQANPFYLLIALMLLPISYLITSRRWHMLLEALDIHMGQGRAFVLNMVGSFYNSFMPGSTGGDLIKAYYASKHTTHKARAVMSVIIDRVVGLLALIILGGVMAGMQWQIHTCRGVALVSAGLIALTVVGLWVFYHPDLRRKSGLDWLLKKMPMQRHVHKAVEAMEMYGRKPGVVIAALVMTFPVHITTIVSATFAGKAFGLPLHPLYYWAIVPVITLVGAIPISPQGAGVMEAMAVELTHRQGVAVSQAFALVMAIRFCQIFWNLVAAIFVLRGGYHAPTEQEAQTLDEDEEEGSGFGVQGSEDQNIAPVPVYFPAPTPEIRESSGSPSFILNPEP
jgi:uncharacterized protein (TIRG00374 family)